MTQQKPCTHLDQIKEVVPQSEGCAQCIALGDSWVELRLCLSCGNVGCCDSSKNMHATKHFKETGHAIMQSAEEGDSWKWCYLDEQYV